MSDRLKFVVFHTRDASWGDNDKQSLSDIFTIFKG